MVWGVDTVLTSDRLKDLSPARALTFVEVSYLPNDALEHCLELYPGDAKRVRSEVVWMAVRRGIPSYVRETNRLAGLMAAKAAALKAAASRTSKSSSEAASSFEELFARHVAAAAARLAETMALDDAAATVPGAPAISPELRAEQMREEAALAAGRLGRRHFNRLLRNLGFNASKKADASDMLTVTQRIFSANVHARGALLDTVSFSDVLSFFNTPEAGGRHSGVVQARRGSLAAAEEGDVTGRAPQVKKDGLLKLLRSHSSDVVARSRGDAHSGGTRMTGSVRATITRQSTQTLSAQLHSMHTSTSAEAKADAAASLEMVIDRKLEAHQNVVAELLASFRADSLAALEAMEARLATAVAPVDSSIKFV